MGINAQIILRIIEGIWRVARCFIAGHSEFRSLLTVRAPRGVMIPAGHNLTGKSIPNIFHCTDEHLKQSVQCIYASDIAVRRCKLQTTLIAATTRISALSRSRESTKCNGIGFELGIEPNRGQLLLNSRLQMVLKIKRDGSTSMF